MKKHYAILSALTLIVSATMVLGCGDASEKTAQEVVEKAIEAGTNGEVDIDISKDGESGSINIKGKDGETLSIKADGADGEGGSITLGGEDGAATMKFGDQAKLPDDFPKDIPMYPGLKVLTVTSMPTEEAHIVMAQSADALDKVAAFYKKEAAAKGWKEEMTMNQGEMHMLNYSKDGHALNVVVAKDDENGGAMVNITTGKM